MSDLLPELKKAILEGDDDLAVSLSKQALEAGTEPSSIGRSLMSGIQEAGELWKKNEYFMSDVALSAVAFKAAMEIVEPHMTKTAGDIIGKILIGTVAGDMHNLGKMMVITMLRAAKFEVTDLGEDVPGATFIDKVNELKPDILGLGCYMTTTLSEMEDIITGLRNSTVSHNVKVMIGGIPTSQDYADRIGADGWGKDALDAVEKAKLLMRRKQNG